MPENNTVTPLQRRIPETAGDRHQAILRCLQYDQGITYSQIAEATGMTRQQVRLDIYELRKKKVCYVVNQHRKQDRYLVYRCDPIAGAPNDVGAIRKGATTALSRKPPAPAEEAQAQHKSVGPMVDRLLTILERMEAMRAECNELEQQLTDLLEEVEPVLRVMDATAAAKVRQ